MTKRLKTKPYLKPSEVAELLRVEPGTVRLWNQSGKLRGTTTAGGHRRFNYRDVEAFAKEHNIELATPDEGTLRVLIVDDDKRVARVMERYIGGADGEVEVKVSHDGFSAGQMVEKFEPHFLVLDLIMPGIDGFQLCQSLKSDPATKGIRIVAITGHADPAYTSKIIELGAEVCLQKPVAKEDLLAALGL